MNIDYSAIDRAVEKVIAKHEMMFAMDMIGREKEPEDLASRVWFYYSKAMRMNALLVQFKQKLNGLRDKTSAPTSSRTYILDGIKGGFVSADGIIKLLNESGIKASLT